jgi:DNA (cytosine-5)-methyltransferase 1/tRNA (cytosine38-C5)-methyltransferase
VEEPGLYLPAAVVAKHGPGLDIVTEASRRTGCFIGGYGRRYVGSGSFLRTERGIRRFSPAEIARLMAFPEAPRFPPNLPLEVRYKLLGNSMNVAVARWALGAFGD